MLLLDDFVADEGQQVELLLVLLDLQYLGLQLDEVLVGVEDHVAELADNEGIKTDADEYVDDDDDSLYGGLAVDVAVAHRGQYRDAEVEAHHVLLHAVPRVVLVVDRVVRVVPVDEHPQAREEVVDEDENHHQTVQVHVRHLVLNSLYQLPDLVTAYQRVLSGGAILLMGVGGAILVVRIYLERFSQSDESLEERFCN